MTRPKGLTEAKGPRSWLIYVCPVCGHVKSARGYKGARDENPIGRNCHNLYEHPPPYAQVVDMDMVMVEQTKNFSDNGEA